VLFFFTKVCILFEQFPTKNLKKGYKKKKRKQRRKPLLVDGQNKFISMLEPNGHQ